MKHRALLAAAASLALLGAVPAHPSAAPRALPSGVLTPIPSPSPLPCDAIPPSTRSPVVAESVGVWTIYTSQIDGNQKTGDFTAPCKLFVRRADGDMSGDRAQGNFDKSLFTIYGHVVIHETSAGVAGIARSSKVRRASTLTADQVHVDNKAKVYVATGHVHYVQGNVVTEADTATLDEATHTLDLEGNVHMVQAGRSMQAGHVLYDIITQQFHAEPNVIVRFPSNPGKGGIHTTIPSPRPRPTRH